MAISRTTGDSDANCYVVRLRKTNSVGVCGRCAFGNVSVWRANRRQTDPTAPLLSIGRHRARRSFSLRPLRPRPRTTRRRRRSRARRSGFVGTKAEPVCHHSHNLGVTGPRWREHEIRPTIIPSGRSNPLGGRGGGQRKQPSERRRRRTG